MVTVTRPDPLGWSAQLSAHAAFIEARPGGVLPEPTCSAPIHTRRPRASADRKREALLAALQDGRPHPFCDLRAALPGASAQGVTYLLESLEADQRIAIHEINRTRRTYQLI